MKYTDDYIFQEKFQISEISEESKHWVLNETREIFENRIISKLQLNANASENHKIKCEFNMKNRDICGTSMTVIFAGKAYHNQRCLEIYYRNIYMMLLCMCIYHTPQRKLNIYITRAFINHPMVKKPYVILYNNDMDYIGNFSGCHFTDIISKHIFLQIFQPFPLTFFCKYLNHFHWSFSWSAQFTISQHWLK